MKAPALLRLPILLRWMLATGLGYTAGALFGYTLTLLLSRLPGVNEDRAFVLVALLCLGLGAGLFQSLLCSDRLPGPGYWISATFAGHFCALAAFAIPTAWLNLPASSLVDDALLLALVGALVGICQWVVLGIKVRLAGWWVPASSLGFLSLLWAVAVPSTTMSGFVLVIGALGALAALLPGLVLAWLPARP